MAARFTCVLVAIALLAVGACGSQSATTGRSAASSAGARASTFVPPTLPPSDASPMPGSRVATVYFASLPAGSHPVHLHARCSASQSFHLAVIGYLAVASDGQGAISVPAQDFGRGWCLIVYGGASLQSVVTTRSI